MLSKLKSALIGTPLPTQQLGEKRLNKIRALAAFSPDALSSIAYANQEIYLGLVVAGSAGLGLAWPIGLAIIGILDHCCHLILSDCPWLSIWWWFLYCRPCQPGHLAGLGCCGALLLDYLLCAAVSLTAGVDAIASAFPALYAIPNWDCLRIARAHYAG